MKSSLDWFATVPGSRVALLTLGLTLSACAAEPLDSGGAGSGGARETGSGGSGVMRGGRPAGTGGQGGTVCPGVLCDIHCEYGNRVDADGCPLCSCNPPPMCEDLTCPPFVCANGQAKDARGCPTCDCNPVGHCSEDACGAAPPVARYCPDGLAQAARCGVRNDGSCGWQWQPCASCPPVRCDLACEHGLQRNEQGCEQCACNPGPGACGAEECGRAPILDVGCEDGSSPRVACERDGAGRCGWRVLGCECPAVACLLACPYGFARDASGCEVCTCNPPPQCRIEDCGPATPGAAVRCPDGSLQGQSCVRGERGSCHWMRTPCPLACAQFNSLGACEANAHCQWLEPGCSGEKLPRAGCHERALVGCEERGCPQGQQCRRFTVDHCAGRPELRCITCAAPVGLCVASTQL